MTKHRVVPVSRDLDYRATDANEPGFRCAGCGLRGTWAGSIVFDSECPAPLLFPEQEEKAS